MPSHFVTVTCPSCFQSFEIAALPPEELPAEFDYDCEICCRPMLVQMQVEEDDIWAEARGINE